MNGHSIMNYSLRSQRPMNRMLRNVTLRNMNFSKVEMVTSMSVGLT